MSFLDRPIDVPNDHKVGDGFRGGGGILPEGSHTVRVESAEVRTSRSGHFKMINAFLKGPSGGVYTNMMISTTRPNEASKVKAVDIGIRQIQDMAAIGGLTEVSHPEDLVGIELDVEILHSPSQTTGKPLPEIVHIGHPGSLTIGSDVVTNLDERREQRSQPAPQRAERREQRSQPQRVAAGARSDDWG